MFLMYHTHYHYYRLHYDGIKIILSWHTVRVVQRIVSSLTDCAKCLKYNISDWVLTCFTENNCQETFELGCWLLSQHHQQTVLGIGPPLFLYLLLFRGWENVPHREFINQVINALYVNGVGQEMINHLSQAGKKQRFSGNDIFISLTSSNSNWWWLSDKDCHCVAWIPGICMQTQVVIGISRRLRYWNVSVFTLYPDRGLWEERNPMLCISGYSEHWRIQQWAGLWWPNV